MNDVRRWFHYPIIMPVTADGQGPATVGVDADRVTFEVWDVLLNSHASFDNLPDAINEAMRLNDAMGPRRPTLSVVIQPIRRIGRRISRILRRKQRSTSVGRPMRVVPRPERPRHFLDGLIEAH